LPSSETFENRSFVFSGPTKFSRRIDSISSNRRSSVARRRIEPFFIEKSKRTSRCLVASNFDESSSKHSRSSADRSKTSHFVENIVRFQLRTRIARDRRRRNSRFDFVSILDSIRIDRSIEIRTSELVGVESNREIFESLVASIEKFENRKKFSSADVVTSSNFRNSNWFRPIRVRSRRRRRPNDESSSDESNFRMLRRRIQKPCRTRFEFVDRSIVGHEIRIEPRSVVPSFVESSRSKLASRRVRNRDSQSFASFELVLVRREPSSSSMSFFQLARIPRRRIESFRTNVVDSSIASTRNRTAIPRLRRIETRSRSVDARFFSSNRIAASSRESNVRRRSRRSNRSEFFVSRFRTDSAISRSRCEGGFRREPANFSFGYVSRHEPRTPIRTRRRDSNKTSRRDRAKTFDDRTAPRNDESRIREVSRIRIRSRIFVFERRPFDFFDSSKEIVQSAELSRLLVFALERRAASRPSFAARTPRNFAFRCLLFSDRRESRIRTAFRLPGVRVSFEFVVGRKSRFDSVRENSVRRIFVRIPYASFRRERSRTIVEFVSNTRRNRRFAKTFVRIRSNVRTVESNRSRRINSRFVAKSHRFER